MLYINITYLYIYIFPIGYSPLAIPYWLFPVGYSLLAMPFWLLPIDCSMNLAWARTRAWPWQWHCTGLGYAHGCGHIPDCSQGKALAID